MLIYHEKKIRENMLVQDYSTMYLQLLVIGLSVALDSKLSVKINCFNIFRVS